MELLNRIALIDDNSISRGMLGEMVKSYFEEKKENVTIDEFSSGEELLTKIDEGVYYDMYFMDIIMPGLRGVDVANIVREKDKNGLIVYLTATIAFEKKSEETTNSEYILKPIANDKIAELLDKIYNK